MVMAIRQVEEALGSSTLDLTPRAQKARESARSLFVVKDLKKGEVLSAQNIRSLRPAKGLHPKYYDSILGKKVKRDIEKGTPLDIEMLE